MDLLYIYMENKTRRRNTSMLSMVIDSISSFMYSKLLVIMLIGTGVYFTIRTKFLQVRLFRSACKAMMQMQSLLFRH